MAADAAASSQSESESESVGVAGDVDITRLVCRKLELLGSFGRRPRTGLREVVAHR